LSDPSARGSAFTKDYQLAGSLVSLVSPVLVNDARFQWSRRRVVTRAGDLVGPGIEIAGLARFGQPYDAEGSRREDHVELVDNVVLTRPNSEWKAGATLNDVRLRDDAREGFDGLFVFRDVEAFRAGRPALWRQAFGDPSTRFGVTHFGGFLQNQRRVGDELTINLGVRYDVTRLPDPFPTDANNVSPRLGLAWSPSSAWVVRAGFGLFYDRLPLAYLNRAIQKDGARAFEQVALEEEAVRVFEATGGGRAAAPVGGIARSVFRVNPDFPAPYSLQANVGFERLLAQDLTLRADYLFTRGIHLPRTRNVNLLPPVVLTAVNAATLGVEDPTPQQLGRPVFGPGRVDPRFDAIYQLENTANSTYHGLTLALNKRLSDEWQLLATHTLSKTIDDASDFDEQPANPYDLRSERALSRHHVGQRFTLNGVFEIEFEEEEEGGGDGEEGESLVQEIFGDIEIAPILTVSSGRLVNPLTGADDDRSLAWPLASRPLGTVRNGLRTPAFANLDLRVVKYVPFGGRKRLDIVVELFNVFNHPNVVGLNPSHGPGLSPLPTFGMPTVFSEPRQLRFSLDFEF